MRICKKCLIYKPISHFYLIWNRKKTRRVRRTICKPCKIKHSIEYQKKFPERTAFTNLKAKRVYFSKKKNRERRKKRMISYLALPGKKERIRYLQKRWRKENRDQVNAKLMIGYHVRMGYIKKPKTCQDCAIETKVEAHHHNGYSKKHKLDVVWLCKMCHEYRHHKDMVKQKV